jgi:hypothetical protein
MRNQGAETGPISSAGARERELTRGMSPALSPDARGCVLPGLARCEANACEVERVGATGCIRFDTE